MPQRRRRRNIDVNVLAEIQKLSINDGASGAAIHRALDSDDRFTGRVPSLRTVQDVFKQLTATDESGPWSLGEAVEKDEASLVLPVLAELLANATLGVSTLSVNEARWIARVRRASPDVPPLAAYHIARTYLAREARGEAASDVDAVLALRPWDGTGAIAPLTEAHEAGRVSTGAFLLGSVVYAEALAQKSPQDVDTHTGASSDGRST